jgi:DNA gyrase subunit A
VIDLIRKAPDVDAARARLMKRFKLSELQAQAILEMQLRRLAALERKKIEDEYKELIAQIKVLESLLRSPLKLRQTVAAELHQVKEAYADRRRTQITRLGAGAKSVLPVLTANDLLPEQTVWVSATSDGLLSRTLDEKPPRISGSMAPRFLLQVNTRDTLFLVSDVGDAAGIPVQTLPEAENPQDGAPFHKVSALTEGSSLSSLFTLPPKEERLEGWFVFSATQAGMLKKTGVEELPGPTGHQFTLVKVNEDDKLGWIRLTDGKSEVLLVTADGMAIRFSEDEIRPMGLVAAGVGGIKLGARDCLIGMELIPRRGDILLITSDGKAKRVAVDQFPRQGRYGQGVIAWKLPRTAQLVGVAAGKPNTRVIIILDKLSPKAIRMDEAPLQTRVASGKTIVELKPGYQVLGLSTAWAVPRPVAGEKAALEKEIDIPEAPTEPEIPEVEQLSFGMIESGLKDTSIVDKSNVHRAPTAKKAGANSAPIKAKTRTGKEKRARKPGRPKTTTSAPPAKGRSEPKAEQAALISDTTPTTKKSPTVKTGRKKSAKTTGSPKRETTGKVHKARVIPKPQVEKKKAKAVKKVPSTSARNVNTVKVKTPSRISTPISRKKSVTSARNKSTPNQDKSPTKVSSVKGGSKAATKTKASAQKVTRQPSKASTKKGVAKNPRQKKMTIKPAVAPAAVILPPSWKPNRSTNPAARRKRPLKPKP